MASVNASVTLWRPISRGQKWAGWRQQPFFDIRGKMLGIAMVQLIGNVKVILQYCTALKGRVDPVVR